MDLAAGGRYTKTKRFLQPTKKEYAVSLEAVERFCAESPAGPGRAGGRERRVSYGASMKSHKVSDNLLSLTLKLSTPGRKFSLVIADARPVNDGARWRSHYETRLLPQKSLSEPTIGGGDNDNSQT